MRAPRTMMAALLAGALALGCAGALIGCNSPAPIEAGASGTAGNATPDAAPNLIDPSQLPDSSFIYDASIKDLQTADSYMEGQTVQVIGEVVGDLILSDYDPEECWITLQANDGNDAEISVSMPLSQSKLIDMYGAYGKRGTTLQVRGTFTLACADHDGLTDIHADHVAIVSRGSLIETLFDITSFLPGTLLVCAGIALTLVYRHLSERRR